MCTGKVECTDANGRNRAAGRTYVALDNETPAAIAIKLGLDAKELVALNKELYPTLSQNAKLKADTVLRLGDLDLRSNADAGLQTVTKTFWTHRAGPLLEELVDCIEELQKQHEVLVFNQKYSGRASIRSRVRDHLESYERTHPGLYVCTELSYGTRRRLSANALQQGREMGFSSTFFKTFEGFRTHGQLVAAVRKLLEGGGVTRKELFDGCEQDGVQPFRSQSHFSNWLNGPLASDELENAVDQMLWNRIDETRNDKLLIMKTGNKQDLEGKKSLEGKNEEAAGSLSTSCIESYKKYHQMLLCKYSCDHGCGYTGVFGDVEAHEAVCTFQTADQTRRRVSLVPQKPADAGDSMLMDETKRENFESADEIYKKT